MNQEERQVAQLLPARQRRGSGFGSLHSARLFRCEWQFAQHGKAKRGGRLQLIEQTDFDVK
ncbi:MAG: hypothetical protein PVH65_14990, partial [Chloroflexota bacterium]